MLKIIINLILFITIFYCVTVKSRKSLHMLQQNLYDENHRYLKWLKQNRTQALKHYDVVALILLIVSLFTGRILTSILLIICFLIYILDSEAIKYSIMIEKAKKPLVKTARVKRQITTLYLLNLVPIFLYLLLGSNAKYLLVLAGLMLVLNYYVVYVVKLINDPIEKAIYKKFWRMAEDKLASYKDLKVIGITGSYGKTSSKNVLNDILSMEYVSHPTPKNFNTDVGLMTTINNDLNKFDEVFIAEMGAYRVGRIKNACNLVHPKYGLLTTIGKAHLETFGSQENIVKTKFELIESLPSDGIAFLNMDDKLQTSYDLKNDVRVVWYAVNNKKADFYVLDSKCSASGSTFKIFFKKENKAYEFQTRLLGRHNIYNIVSGVAIGYEFGISIPKLQAAVSGIKPVEHRLELKKIGGMYQIDDAYNSNPVGAKVALEVLKMMPGDKVVVTPGMVELGSEEDKYNFEFGEEISEVADYVILVGEKKTKPIYDGLMAKKYDKDKIIITNDVRETYIIANKLKSKKDIYALYENDLPDTYNE